MIPARHQRNFRRAVLAMGLLAVALIAAVVTMRLAIHGAEVDVPDFRGQTAADAIRHAADAGLSATIADRSYSASAPAGTVVSQFPEPEATVRRNWIVRLVESLGPQLVAVPRVTGMQQRAAVLAIRQAHLDLGTVAIVSYLSAPAGTVIAQDPPASDHGGDRARVALLVASGGGAGANAGLLIVPNVVGQPFQQAAISVASAGFKLGPLAESGNPQASGRLGVVIAQKPAAGMRASAGAAIQLTVMR
jgi:beta-lactam-binding protein with PASTA domain